MKSHQSLAMIHQRLVLFTIILLVCLVMPARSCMSGSASLVRILSFSGGARHPNDESSRYPPDPRRRPKQKSTLQRLAEQSLSLTTKAVTSTAKQSGKAAYWAVRPKRVEWRELVGLWRLDQALYDSNRPEVANIELTPTGNVVVKSASGQVDQSRVKFVKASRMGASARLEFFVAALPDAGDDRFFYKAYVHRKVADPSVIKLKGKIYRIERAGWRGQQERRIAIGTFVARRRMRLEEDEWSDDEDQNEEEDWTDEDEKERDDGDEGVDDEEEEYDEEEYE